MNLLAAWLRATREARGMHQTDVADALSVTQGSVSRWETGRTVPPLQSVMRWARLMRITSDELARVLLTWSKE